MSANDNAAGETVQGLSAAPSHLYIETSNTDLASGMPSLADGSVDVIITDPPYSEYVHTRSRGSSPGSVAKRARGIIKQDRALDFACLTPDVMHLAAYHFGRIAKRWVLVFCAVEDSHSWALAMRLAGLEYVRTLAWVKEGGTPQFTGDRPAAGFEAIVLAHPPGKKRWNGGGRPGVYRVPIAHGRREHTAQKPLALMEMLVRDFTEHGELILDPFAGAATTGVAAKVNGRRFVGMEKDPHWFRVGARRLLRAREQLELALAPVTRTKAKQGALAL